MDGILQYLNQYLSNGNGGGGGGSPLSPSPPVAGGGLANMSLGPLGMLGGMFGSGAQGAKTNAAGAAKSPQMNTGLAQMGMNLLNPQVQPINWIKPGGMGPPL
jgi:hypothetical protein